MSQKDEYSFAEFVFEIVIHPEQEEFVFQENVVMSEKGPKHKLIHCYWETAFK